MELNAFCPTYHRAVEIIGRRWTGAIVRAMLCGVDRFGEIAATVPGVSDRMLSERLKELEQERIVERVVHAETPVRVEYRLTEKGRDLAETVVALTRWAETWAERERERAGGLATPLACRKSTTALPDDASPPTRRGARAAGDASA